MSKIFDALRRSEGERAGSESTAGPQGPEMLREAERRVASNWEAEVFANEPDPEILAEKKRVLSEQLAAGIGEYPSLVPTPSLLSSVERAEMLKRFSTLAASITPASHLASMTDRKSPTAEAVRLLALRLRDLRRSRTLKKVVITSTIPREGKSTIASNLACSLARRAEEKILLIEGDMRLPAVLRMFGIDQQPGLCELLRGERDIADCVYYVAQAGIWILPAGVSTSNPLELLQSQKMPFIMDQLSACFDWIVIDSPPVLPLADTSVWMRISDGVLLVTRQGVTEKKLLKKGLEALEPQKVLGALLNGSQASRYSSYYYGDSSSS